MTNKIKEFQFQPNISKHDLEIKINKIKKLLDKNFEIKASVIFKGREIIHSELGMKILKDVAESVGKNVELKQTPILKGRVLSIIILGKSK